MTQKELFHFYNDKFQLIYADLVAIKGDKPTEIVLQIESFVSHLAVANTTTDDEQVKSNLTKAQGHLQRACLDAAKMLWKELKERADRVYKKKGVLDWCIKDTSSTVKSMYQRANDFASEARRIEVQNIGKNPEASIEKYYESANEFQNFLRSIDWDRVEKFSAFDWKNIIKSQFIGFIFGILASAIVAILAWKYLPVS